MSDSKKVCVFLGSRANYSSLKSIMTEVIRSEALELVLFVGASALLDKYGEVVDLVEADGFRVDEKVYMLVEGENLVTMAKSAGLGLLEFPRLFDKYRPDYTLVVGDRFEMLSVAVASLYMNVPVVHTMGGEFSGTVDETIRHAITKMSHVHFVANEMAMRTVLQMGEDPNLVFNVGCPRMDAVREILERPFNKDEINHLIRSDGVGAVFDVDSEFLLVLQHPVTTEFGQGEQQINETLKAVHSVAESRDVPVIMLWPNADAGSDDVARGIRKFRERGLDRNFHFFKNLPLELYVQLMAHTSCLVGNSSSGIREGAFIGTPVVNVGTRQDNRARGANVIDVGYDATQIEEAILKQVEHGRYPSDPVYGSGDAGAKIAKILAEVEVPVQKKFHVRDF
ncbi:MAG: UDP-N-acetylglucosamine 2-epimerase [Promethearchaeota archaeon]